VFHAEVEDAFSRRGLIASTLVAGFGNLDDLGAARGCRRSPPRRTSEMQGQGERRPLKSPCIQLPDDPKAIVVATGRRASLGLPVRPTETTIQQEQFSSPPKRCSPACVNRSEKHFFDIRESQVDTRVEEAIKGPQFKDMTEEQARDASLRR